MQELSMAAEGGQTETFGYSSSNAYYQVFFHSLVCNRGRLDYGHWCTHRLYREIIGGLVNLFVDRRV